MPLKNITSHTKVLDLALTFLWYDKIDRGEKQYEYREIKPYWTKRLLSKPYEIVRFRRGYTKTTMCFALIGIEETTEPNDLNLSCCYRLKLGARKNHPNLHHSFS